MRVGEVQINTRIAVKYLSVTLDPKLKYRKQIEKAADKAAKVITALSRRMDNIWGPRSGKSTPYESDKDDSDPRYGGMGRTTSTRDAHKVYSLCEIERCTQKGRRWPHCVRVGDPGDIGSYSYCPSGLQMQAYSQNKKEIIQKGGEEKKREKKYVQSR